MSVCTGIALLAAASLYEQSAARILAQRFADPSVSYLVADASTGRLIASKWAEPDRPISVGSLVKPFVALALSERRTRHCNGERCWQSAGHGDVDFVHAIAYSCNLYFLDAVAALNQERLAATLARFGLDPPGDRALETCIGLGRNWLLSPLTMLRAYRLLLSDRSAADVRAGMRLSAEGGTAHLIHVDALTKTGTAPCSHTARAPGDSFILAAWPADEPHYISLVRVHNTTGSNAARTAGEMVRAIRDGH